MSTTLIPDWGHAIYAAGESADHHRDQAGRHLVQAAMARRAALADGHRLLAGDQALQAAAAELEYQQLRRERDAAVTP